MEEEGIVLRCGVQTPATGKGEGSFGVEGAESGIVGEVGADAVVLGASGLHGGAGERQKDQEAFHSAYLSKTCSISVCWSGYSPTSFFRSVSRELTSLVSARKILARPIPRSSR